MSPRTIHLRRPATLSVQAGVFVPTGAPGILDEIDRCWNNLCESNPAYFDGRLYHVLGVHRNGHGGCVLHVIDCAYRFLAVQNDGRELGVRGLGIKGVTERDGQYLLGRRSMNVSAYRGLWEFAPAGGVEPGREPAETIRHEMLEETGLRCEGEPVPIAVLFDPVLKCWELVFRVSACGDDLSTKSGEYSQLEWRSGEALPAELSPVARQIAELLGEIGSPTGRERPR